MAKYAFFIETDHRLTGDQKNMLFLAKQLSKDPENVVYYINNIYQEDICLLQDANVIVADANSFDYAQLEGANIFVPTNYLFFLLSRIDKTIKYAKICLWSYDGGSLSRLFAQNRAKRNSSNFLAMIKKRNAVVFSNRLVFYQHCIKYGVFKEKYQPLCFDNIKTLRRKKTVSSRIINIAYFSNINSVDAAIITSLCNNIINNANLNNKKVNLHIVGNGGGAWQIDFSKFSSKIHFIYTGDLKDEDLHQYLQNNVDIVFANGEFALESASCSMPTVVPLYSKTQHDNMYVWFYNIKDFDNAINIFYDEFADSKFLIDIIKPNFNTIKNYYNFSFILRYHIFSFYFYRDTYKKLLSISKSKYYFSSIDEYSDMLIPLIQRIETRMYSSKSEWIKLINILYEDKKDLIKRYL